MPAKKGFSLIELLVAVSVLAILITIAILSIGKSRDKADDARAKADLERLKVAFEDYYNDNNCYPPATWLDDATDCNSNVLSPYLNSLPCDRRTGLPYVLETDASGCSWYRLYATLKNAAEDPQALALCDLAGSNLGNYGVGSGNVAVNVYCEVIPSPTPSPSSAPASSTPTPTPTPTPTSSPIIHNYYWCSAIGNCTLFDNNLYNCTPSYIDSPNCDDGVSPCSTVGSCTPR